MRSMAVALLLVSSLAHAETKREKAAPADPRPSLLESKTNIALAPTGATVPAGKWQVTLYEMGVVTDIAYGLTDYLEASIGMAALSIPGAVGHLKVRLTPKAFPVRLTVGG